VGGAAGAVLTKNTATNYDTGWVTPTGAAHGVLTATVDQTAATEQVHVVYTVPANSVAIGTTFRMVAWGNADNGTTAITFTPRIRWGGVSGFVMVAQPTIVSSTTTNTSKSWKLSGLITFWSIGLSGSAQSQMFLSNHTASTTASYAADEFSNGILDAPLDTTVNKDLVLTWQISATTGLPHVRTSGGWIETVKP
jgi:hypothetical protein